MSLHPGLNRTHKNQVFITVVLDLYSLIYMAVDGKSPRGTGGGWLGGLVVRSPTSDSEVEGLSATGNAVANNILCIFIHHNVAIKENREYKLNKIYLLCKLVYNISDFNSHIAVKFISAQ